MPTNAHYIERMKTQLKEWDAEVDELAKEGAKVGEQARVAYDEQLESLRATREGAHKTFEEIRFASESAGLKLRAGMDAAWDSMRKSFQKASTSLRK